MAELIFQLRWLKNLHNNLNNNFLYQQSDSNFQQIVNNARIFKTNFMRWPWIRPLRGCTIRLYCFIIKIRSLRV